MKYSNGKSKKRRYMDMFTKSPVFSCAALGISSGKVVSLMRSRNTTVENMSEELRKGLSGV